MNKLQQTVRLALVALLLLSCVPTAVAWFSLQTISRNSARATIAHEVLDTHLLLGIEGERLELHLENGGRPEDETGRKRMAAIAAHISHIRADIVEEVEVIGAGGAEEEADEFVGLDKILASLELVAKGTPDNVWRAEIERAIAHERIELAELQRRNAAASLQIKLLLTASLIGAFAIAAIGLVWLRSAIIAPTFSVLRGMQQITAGDREFRIEPSGHSALQGLHRVFNRMADQFATAARVEARNRKELEAAVASRSADLRKANDQLIEVSERRKQFLADVSHELRTPLAIIGGEADVALRDPKATAAEHRESLQRVQDQARGMTRLVDDLLFLARNEAGPAPARLKPLNLFPLVKAATGALQPLLAADGGALDFIPAVPSAPILGDEGRLRQLLGILLDNAVHYSEQAAQIVVSLDQVRDGFVISVKDKGVGIAPDELPLLFERFRRGSSGAERNADGSGLGLPLAKAIVESHGGSITIESTLKKGTKVAVFLPVAVGKDGS